MEEEVKSVLSRHMELIPPRKVSESRSPSMARSKASKSPARGTSERLPSTRGAAEQTPSELLKEYEYVVARLSSALDVKTAEVRAAAEEAAEYGGLIGELRSRNETIVSQNWDLRQELEDCRTQLKAARRATSTEQTEGTELQSGDSGNQQSVRSLQRRLETERQQWISKVAKLEAERSALRDGAMEHEKALNEVRSALGEKEHRCRKLRAEVSQLQEESASKAAKVDQLMHANKELHQDCFALRDLVGAMKLDAAPVSNPAKFYDVVREIKTEYQTTYEAATEREVAQLQGYYTEANKKLAGKDTQIAALETQLDKQVEDERRKVAELRAEIERCKNALYDAKREAEKKVWDLANELDIRNNEFHDVVATNTMQRNQLAKLKCANDDLIAASPTKYDFQQDDRAERGSRREAAVVRLENDGLRRLVARHEERIVHLEKEVMEAQQFGASGRSDSNERVELARERVKTRRLQDQVHQLAMEKNELKGEVDMQYARDEQRHLDLQARWEAVSAEKQVLAERCDLLETEVKHWKNQAEVQMQHKKMAMRGIRPTALQLAVSAGNGGPASRTAAPHRKTMWDLMFEDEGSDDDVQPFNPPTNGKGKPSDGGPPSEAPSGDASGDEKRDRNSAVAALLDDL